MIAIPVTESSQVAAARHEAAALASKNEIDADGAGRLALVATELATNLVKHGGGGEILIGAFSDEDGSGIELLALDRGKGMGDVQACLVDGFSTAGSNGAGLGTVMRQSNFVDIASWVDVGTAVLARIRSGSLDSGRMKRAQSRTGWGAVSVPKPGEDVCGDSWSIASADGTLTLFVADGLGHGQEAAEASVEAVRLFHRYGGHQVATVLDYIHGGLRATRGAAASIARVAPTLGKIEFAGVGNVAGLVFSGGASRHMVSMAGTAGYNARKTRAFDYPFTSGLVVLHSDGLSSNVGFDRYPNLAGSHPTTIAGILYRDFARHRDDATVLVGKWIAQ